MRISDWSSDVCSSDLQIERLAPGRVGPFGAIDDRPARNRGPPRGFTHARIGEDAARREGKIDLDRIALPPFAIERPIARTVGRSSDGLAVHRDTYHPDPLRRA